MDMSNAFIAGAGRYFPGARVIFDHFHLMKMAGQALDNVRKALAGSGADLKGSIWAIRGNEWTRAEQQLCARRKFARQYPVLGRALSLRECLQGVLAIGKEADLDWWCGWADRSRRQPFRKLSKSIKARWDGILAFIKPRLTKAAMEAVNGIIQIAKRMAGGGRNFHYFRIAAYLKAGGHQLNILQG
jgi:transposase